MLMNGQGFNSLDPVPHTLTAMKIYDPASIHIVEPTVVPTPIWLRPSIPCSGKQEFGDDLISRHKFILIPSTLSTHSWNLIFIAAFTKGIYTLRSQETFELDTRFHPPGGLKRSRFRFQTAAKSQTGRTHSRRNSCLSPPETLNPGYAFARPA
jgi:hypothetical protein